MIVRGYKLLIAILLFSLSMEAAAQTAHKKAQRELIGSRLLTLEFTDWLLNKPADTTLNARLKVLEFWASWCKPCLEAVPHLNQLQRHFSDSSVLFLSITNEAPAVAQKGLSKVRFETVVVSDQTNRLQHLLRVAYQGQLFLPQTVVLDGNNRILWYGTPLELSAERINQLLHSSQK